MCLTIYQNRQEAHKMFFLQPVLINSHGINKHQLYSSITMWVNSFDFFVHLQRNVIRPDIKPNTLVTHAHILVLIRNTWNHNAMNAPLLLNFRIPPKDMMAINFSHNPRNLLPSESKMISHHKKTIWPVLMPSASGINLHYSHSCIH